MNLGQFLGLPMMAGPRDIPMGEDELGNILYAAGGTPSGQRYTKKTAPANRASVVKALVKGAKAKPWETVGNLVTGAAQGAWDAVAAPGRAASGEPITMGDVANTAGLVSLPAVAGKYDPAVANMGLRYTRPEGDDFRGWHKAPGRGADNGTFDNLSSIYPDDIYDRRVAAQYYGHGGEPWERSTIDSFAAARGNPDAEVMVYRAVPEGIDDIFAGDWVTPNRAYAEMHGNSWVDDGKYKILAEKVRAGDLYTDANSIHEFGWDPPPRIRAYHGSPHDFDRFDLSKVGTGEGAQAYGHGLYFAEAEDVARQYRDDLSGGNVSAAKRSLARAGGDIDAAIQRRRDNIERLQNMPDAGGNPERQAAQIQINRDAIEQLTAFKETGDWTGGRMYEVDINADPADFLDWDAPFSEQPAKVQSHFAHLNKGGRAPDGDELARRIEGRIWRDEAKEAGIPGIKYYDQGSRASGQGTRNYVVFDDSLIEILRKYGLAGLAPLGAILGTQDDEKQRIRDFLTQ